MLPASLTWEPPPSFALLPGPELVYQQCGVRLHFGDREHSRKVPHHWQRFGSPSFNGVSTSTMFRDNGATCFNSRINNASLNGGDQSCFHKSRFFLETEFFVAVWLLCTPNIKAKKRNTECGGIEYDRDIGALQQVDLIINMIECHFFVLVVWRFAN